MSFRLPSPNHPAREAMGDLAHVAEVLNPANLAKLPTLASALRGTRGEVYKPARAIFVIVLDEQTDNRLLIRIGRRGGWRKVWNFGTGRD